MITEYTTADGIHLEIGRIARDAFDDFLEQYPPPEPPTETVEIFGGTEEVQRKNAPEYIAAKRAYNLRLFDAQFSVISNAVLFDYDYTDELEALYMASVERHDAHSDALRHIVLSDKDDAANVVEAVLYNSTVTERGIQEAVDRFGIIWRARPLHTWHVKKAPVKYSSSSFGARRAALHSMITWAEFCQMTGPEQSEIVAFYDCEMRLQWLMSQQ